MWKCPKCSGTDLRVVVMVTAILHQDDLCFHTEAEGTHEWGAESFMMCNDCSHEGTAKDFEKEEGDA